MASRSHHLEGEADPAAALVEHLVTVVQSSSSLLSKEKFQVYVLLFPTTLQIWKKSKKKRLDMAPLPLVWAEDSIQLSRKSKDVDSQLCFELILPMQRWTMLAKNDADKAKIYNSICDAVKSRLKISTIPFERTAAFDWGVHAGIYDGEWLFGRPHGKGRFTTHDGVIFDGDWSSSIAAGYGVMITPTEGASGDHQGNHTVSKVAGWETFFPDEAPREAHNDVLDSLEQQSGLSEADVQMIISHASTRRYTKGDVILHEGEVNDCLYRIKSGVIRLTQESSSAESLASRVEMGPDDMFGEMSVLDKNIISATVVAASDLVELYAIELDVLYELFKTCPGFSKRFHQAMAETLAVRLMRFFEPKMSRGIRQTFSGPLGGVMDYTRVATQWLESWNTRAKSTDKLYLDLVVYRDPWVPNGLEGRGELAQHLNNLKESGRYWTWETPAISTTAEGFRVIAKVQLTSTRTGAVARQDAIVDVTMNRKENKFKSVTIRFDKDQLSVGQPVADVRGGALDAANLASKPQDIKFCHRFNLQEGETILAEKPCVLVNTALSSNVSGTLYISQNFLCFYSKVFDMKTKEVVPIKAIKSVKSKPQISGILIKYNAKTARKVSKVHAELYHTGFDKNLELLFTFPTEFDHIFNEVSTLISKSGASMSKDVSKGSSQEEVAMDGFRVAKESGIQKFARCSQLPDKLPNIPIRRSMNEQGIRVFGPNTTETAEAYGTDLYGRTISTYPMMTKLGNDGVTVLPVNNERQGDPICDQWCVERMENKCIFAVADGCNWGPQPRRAALIASRTFCEFVKHNLSQMTTLQEAGKLFLHAFAAAHHRIVEGWDQAKIWECGTTTLLGGALLELAPTAQYVERRWGIVLSSIGDCKAYLISSRYHTVQDITVGSRSGSAALDASDCGGRLGPYVGDGQPDLRNFSLFSSPAEEGDILILTSDGVYDNLDPQSLGIEPSALGLTGSSWDNQSDYAKVEEIKTQYVCAKIREIVFGEQKAEEIVAAQSAPNADLSSSSAVPIGTRPPKLDAGDIVEKLIAHAVKTTQLSRDFMEQHPDKILPKNYKDYPGKLDHTTCLALRIKRSTFKPIENELDSLVLRMRNPAQGLSTVNTPAALGGLLSLRSKLDTSAVGQVVTLTKGEGIESPRYMEPTPGGNADSSAPADASPTDTTSPLSIAVPSAPSGTSPTTPSVLASSPTAPATVLSSSGKKPVPLKRSNTILNVAIRGSVILRWLRENEMMNELRSGLTAQMLLGFRYIRPLDVENWKNETFNADISYNFQVYEPIMTRNDWEQLLRSSKRVTYTKGSVIVKEGEYSQERLFYIISGRCKTVKTVSEGKERKRKDRLDAHAIKDTPKHQDAKDKDTSKEKDTTKDNSSPKDDSVLKDTDKDAMPTSPSPEPTASTPARHQKGLKKTKGITSENKQNLDVGVMCENETFGEISFLFRHQSSFKASASVMADSDVDLYIIEGSWINILFIKYPGMAGRFYHYLASVLAHRLKKQEILESQRIAPAN